MWPTILFFLLITLHPVATTAYPGSLDAFSGLPSRNLPRRDDPPGQEDYSAFTGFAGSGDSFAAGIGGPAYDSDTKCARGDKGYPNLINEDGRMGDPARQTF